MAKGRKVIETDRAFRLREEMASSVAVSVVKKGLLIVKKRYPWILIINFQLVNVALLQAIGTIVSTNRMIHIV